MFILKFQNKFKKKKRNPYHKNFRNNRNKSNETEIYNIIKKNNEKNYLFGKKKSLNDVCFNLIPLFIRQSFYFE